MVANARTQSRRRSPTRSVLLQLAPLMCAALCGLASPAQAERGQWTPYGQLYEMCGIAIHMALLPGDGNPYHSRVVWWANPGSRGGLLGWQPGSEGCASWPSSFTPIASPSPCQPGTGWSPGADIFCSGHTLLAGKLLTVGGTDFQGHFWGLTDARTYTPGAGSTVGTWTATGQPMSQHRWYPTATTLRDGRVLAASGHKYEHLWFFGGRRNGAPPASGTGDLVHRFARTTGGQWDASVTPEEAAPGDRPVPRQGHAAAFLADRNALAFFGGKDGSGNSVDDGAFVRLLRREEGSLPTPQLGPDYRYALAVFCVKDGSGNSVDDGAFVRLAFLSDVELRFAGRLVPSGEQPTLALASLQSAQQRSGGDVTDAVAGVDNTTAALAGADTLQLLFAAPRLAAGQVRECFLWVEAALHGQREASTGRLEPGTAQPDRPAEFALFPVRPNPFTRRVAVRFSLPLGVVARLEIFDVQGRRAQTLHDGLLPAGYHTVEWDGRDAAGQPAAAGTYFCRLTAGSFQAQRRMTLAQ